MELSGVKKEQIGFYQRAFGVSEHLARLRASSLDPKEQLTYLLEGNMQGEYLGACLDSCRWAGRDSIMYEMNISELVDFIDNWMGQNDDFPSRFNENPTDVQLPPCYHC